MTQASGREDESSNEDVKDLTRVTYKVVTSSSRELKLVHPATPVAPQPPRFLPRIRYAISCLLMPFPSTIFYLLTL
jgi:hypothetical protein